MDQEQAPPRVRRAKSSSRHNRATDPGPFAHQIFGATEVPGVSELTSGGHSDVLHDSPLGGTLEKDSVIWAVVDGRRLVIFDALEITQSQVHDPPSSIHVGYGTYAQAYAALDRARAAKAADPPQLALTPHQDTLGTRLSNHENSAHRVPRPHSAPHRSVQTQTAQSVSSSRRNKNVPHTNPSPSHSYTSLATEGLRTPLGSSATPPMTPRLVHPPLPPYTEGLHTPLSSSATPRLETRHATYDGIKIVISW